MTDELQEVQEEQPQAEDAMDTAADEIADEPSADGETAAEGETPAETEMDESEESDQGEDSPDESSEEL
jgi:hypothetical protein